MTKCETLMEGDRYKLVRYEASDRDELYPAPGWGLPDDAVADLCLDVEEWTAVGRPWAGGESVCYWLHRDGTLCRIFKIA